MKRRKHPNDHKRRRTHKRTMCPASCAYCLSNRLYSTRQRIDAAKVKECAISFPDVGKGVRSK